MSKGVLLFAFNNSRIDYVKQAIYCAKRIKLHLNLPVQLVTDAVEYIESEYPFYKNYIDVVTYQAPPQSSVKTFNDGTLSKKTASFKNANRANVYNLTPYDETLLMDTDYIISNDLFKSCFDSVSNFMLYKKSDDIAKVRAEDEFDTISNTSVDFYWATVVYFRKTETNKTFFDLVSHIEQEWNHYRRVYQITHHYLEMILHLV